MNHLGIEAAENTQFVVWMVEAIAFAVAAAVGWFVWRISKQASIRRKSENE